MNEKDRKDYEDLLEHWNTTFKLTGLEKQATKELTENSEAWRELAPSKKLADALQSMKDCSHVLDYGSGTGWAGIMMAKYGCAHVTCADPAENAVKMTALYADIFGVTDQIEAVCINENWLGEVPDDSFDGFFCSNVLDVIPKEMAEEIIMHASRVIRKDSRAVIGLNYYMSPEKASERGLELRNGSCLYVDGILRLVSRTDEEWVQLFEKYFRIDKLEYFAWPNENNETRRLFYLTKKGEYVKC